MEDNFVDNCPDCEGKGAVGNNDLPPVPGVTGWSPWSLSYRRPRSYWVVATPCSAAFRKDRASDPLEPVSAPVARSSALHSTASRGTQSNARRILYRLFGDFNESAIGITMRTLVMSVPPISESVLLNDP